MVPMEIQPLRRIRGMMALTSLAAVLASSLLAALPVSANHPVLVEGNCFADGPETVAVTPGTCGDYDGDGRVGLAEDADDPADRIFGTINAALAMANNGANFNGRVTIVTSGRFPEVVTITPTAGNVTLEAAPGVEANIDAVLGGEPGSAARQELAGIVVDAPANRQVVIRNIVSRNWTDGILVRGSSHVTLDNVRVENNVNYGIRVTDDARVAITHSHVNASGYRTTAAGPSTANPGGGIAFEGRSTGLVAFTVVTGSVAAGIANATGREGAVTVQNVAAFDNTPDYRGVRPN